MIIKLANLEQQFSRQNMEGGALQSAMKNSMQNTMTNSMKLGKQFSQPKVMKFPAPATQWD